MANNRMLLIHRPSGLAVIIGKHMGVGGWYDPVSFSLLFHFFEAIQTESDGSDIQTEDMCLGMESCAADTPFVNTDWHGYYHDEKYPKLLQVNKITEVPHGEAEKDEEPNTQ